MNARSALLACVAIALAGCGKKAAPEANQDGVEGNVRDGNGNLRVKKPENRSATSGPLASPDGVLAAAQERTRAMCACADSKCRVDVSMQPDDPFGEKAHDARGRFTEAQKQAWKAVTTEWTACSLRK